MRSFLIFTAAVLIGYSAQLQAADDGVNGGTFSAPGYVPPTGARAGGVAGAAGAAAPSSPATIQMRQSTVPERSAAGRNNTPAGAQRNSGDRSNRLEPLPNEFQKFVELATGRLLPVFGSGFFADAGEGLNALDNVPVSADYVVGPGDELVIRAWGSIDVDYRSTVDRNGQVNLPKVGSFNVAGVKAADLEQQLRTQIGRLYTNFTLNVTLGKLRGVRVFVVGPAQRPGVYTLPSQSTVLSAVLAAGGPAPNGSMRKLSLRRNGNVVSEFDIYDFLVLGDKSNDVQLAGGDVVVFQPAGPRVAVTGAIDTAAIFELRTAQQPLREVLRYAGGAAVLANPNQAQLERIDASQRPAARFVEQFKLDPAGLQKPLRDGDVLTLLAISPEFANAVTLKGHVAQPLRYTFTPGMRVRDLIPNAQALISPDFYRRKNFLVQIIEDEPLPGSVPGGPGTAPMAPPGADRAAAARAQKTPAALFDELNWDYAMIERLNPQNLSTQVIPFNLGRAVLQGDETQNLELQSGDVITVYSQKDVRVPVARQTRLVTLDGEIAAPGVYQLQAGETLRQLVARAGGFTPQAYVYGLEFTREETRQRQRENLTAAISRLEALSATQTARDAANRRDDPLADRSTGAVSAAATQAQLQRLQRLQPNGRLALELRPEDSDLNALPDLPLDAGDRISVPTRPGFVTVAGAVVNSNAFLWKPGRTAGDYLKMAGVDEAGDISNMFILRADGTVSHSGDQRGIFSFRSIESQPLQPGDAVIVPSQLDFESFGHALVRNLKDWSQILSQFGLGAAAIKTLRN